MITRRSPIALQKDEDQLFRRLYVQWRIPRGQFKRNPDYLAEFTRVWNKLAGRNDSSISVLHYMDTNQKITKRLAEPWPVFNGAHKILPPVENVLGEEQMEILRELYQIMILPLGLGTEGILYHEKAIDDFARAFAKRTGYGVPGMLLAAAIEDERKAGNWFTLRRDTSDDLGFGDLDKIAQ